MVTSKPRLRRLRTVSGVAATRRSPERRSRGTAIRIGEHHSPRPVSGVRYPVSGTRCPVRRGIRFAVVTVLRTVEALTTCVEVSRRLRYIDQSTADRLQKELARNRQLLHGVL